MCVSVYTKSIHNPRPIDITKPKIYKTISFRIVRSETTAARNVSIWVPPPGSYIKGINVSIYINNKILN